ncbi:hypothetical protein D3C75_1070590 [compost metagenome]
MVVAQVRMRQHIIANRLAFAQAAAMANRRAQHRQMVANGFRIRRADANVNQRDAVTVGINQVPGGHLVFLPGEIGNSFFGSLAVGG